jgi:hypothetical protein
MEKLNAGEGIVERYYIAEREREIIAERERERERDGVREM